MSFAQAVAVALLLLVSAPAAAQKPQHGTFVHLFEWKWNDIAAECEQVLGPAGYSAVQISPPQEHIVGGGQWWIRYQPVSYKLESRSGTRVELAAMVQRCAAVGVDIYVDAVINHMTGVDEKVETGWAGSRYWAYNYPDAGYGPRDFHYCGRNGNNDIRSYQDAYEVRYCELLNLADLAMENDYVRGRLAGYLNDLADLGIKGFRYDAAKHMNPPDLANINSRLRPGLYIFQEVIGAPGEPIKPNQYFDIGDVTEFGYGIEISNHFRDAGRVQYLRGFGEGFGLMPSNKAVVFVENHDNERGHGGAGNVLTWRQGQVYELAVVFMLAWPYGYPKVMSSFDDYLDSDRGPPTSSPLAACGFNNEWKCQHRWRPIRNMVRFRKVAADQPITRWWSSGDAIAFGRGDRAFVVINRNAGGIGAQLGTDLPGGRYCNLALYDWTASGCSGPYTDVGGDGSVRVDVAANTAAIFHVEARQGAATAPPPGGQPPSPPSGEGEAEGECDRFRSTYDRMYLRGTFNQWGLLPMKLTGDYTWEARGIPFGSVASPRFKFDASGDWTTSFGDRDNNGVGDLMGRDIVVGCNGTYIVVFNDKSKAYFTIPAEA